MNLCACCGGEEPPHAILSPYGIQRGAGGEPALILYRCLCGTTRAVPYEEAEDCLRFRAVTIEARRAG